MAIDGGGKILPHIQGIIFDMDGTLTVPVLDFNELRRRLHISEKTDILEYANNCAGSKKKEVFSIIDTFGQEGNRNLKLQPHIHELFLYLTRNNLHKALITRNNTRGVEVFLEKLIVEDKDKVLNSTDIFSQV